MKESKKLEEEGLNIIKNIQERIEINERKKQSENIGKFVFSAGLQLLKNRSKNGASTDKLIEKGFAPQNNKIDVSITFDDGYEDIYIYAKPILELRAVINI